MKIKRIWLVYIFAYLMWVVSMLLGILFLVMGRTTFPVFLGSALAESAFDARQWAIAIDRIFTLVVGMALVVNMVAVESYFRAGVKPGDLTRRLARVFGIQLLLLFIADGAQQLMMISAFISWPRIAVLLLELAAGLFLTIYSFRVQPKKLDRAGNLKEQSTDIQPSNETQP
jgi:hypothetical protein